MSTALRVLNESNRKLIMHYTCLPLPNSWTLFADMYKKGGIAGINKGVNAVALRQMTNWGSR